MLFVVDVGLVIQKKIVIVFNLFLKIFVIFVSGCFIIVFVLDIGIVMRVVKESGGGIVVILEDFLVLV